MDELPIGRTLATRLIKEGVIVSVLVCAPGSKRGVRLVSTKSLEAYLQSLVPNQQQGAGV